MGAALCVVASVAQAGPSQKAAPPGADANHSGQGTIARKLTELNQQQALLQSRLRIEQLQAQIKNAQRAIKGRSGAQAAQAASVYTGSTLPVVSAIIGVGHQYQAILLYPHGIVTADPGDTLPGGVHVRAITQDTVKVGLNGGRITTLMFAGQGGAGQVGKEGRAGQRGQAAQQSRAGQQAQQATSGHGAKSNH